jgi:ribosomal protein S9
MNKVLSGKRKKATARASYKDGTGKVMINNSNRKLLKAHVRIKNSREPLLIAT